VTAGLTRRLDAARRSLARFVAYRVAEAAAVGFVEDRAFSHAAAMAYYAIFSLFPLLLLAMAVLGLVLQNSDVAREQVLGLVGELLPRGQAPLRRAVADVIEARGPAAGIGALVLGWSVLVWFQEVDGHLNRIWGVEKPRPLLQTLGLALAMALGLGGVALASFAATAAVAVLAGATGVIPGSAVVWQAAVSLVSVAAVASAFALLYRYTPQRAVRFADVWPAAVAMAVLWEATRRLLALYLDLNHVISGYGPVGAAMALLVWLYCASSITLAGAELAYAVAKERRHIGPHRELEVIAPVGEQPTPKFAPQVGHGFTTPAGTQEPIRAQPRGALLRRRRD